VNAAELVAELSTAGQNTVIDLGRSGVFDFTQISTPVRIPGGVTIRGSRRGTLSGPFLFEIVTRSQPQRDRDIFEIQDENVRITGIQLQGASPDPKEDIGHRIGIHIDHFEGTPKGYDPHVIIDHNDISMWTEAAVEVDGGDCDGRCSSGPAKSCPPQDITRQHNIRIVRNLIQLNRNDPGGGYGVVLGNGAYPSIDRNTFISNRHSIAGDGSTRAGYSAFFNLVQTAAANNPPQQDFDMHGEEHGDGGHWYGGYAGSEIDIGRNTFLGRRINFELRGKPCALDSFIFNTLRQNQTDAFLWYYFNGNHHDGSSFPDWLDVHDNEFNSDDPTEHLGTGPNVAARLDFDGDGRDDLFLATGQAWYYSSGGVAEWRFLSDASEKANQVLFGDFDGNGRTDVFLKNGRDWVVSWGGISGKRQKINESDGQIGDFAIGDFDGDGRADVFYADGHAWFLSSGGVAPFKKLDTSSYRIPDLRFGDFNGDGKTDVFGVVNGQWMVAHSGTSHWQPLRPKLTDSVAGLVVADFNADGRADVATSSCARGKLGGYCDWKVSYSGTGDWTKLRRFSWRLPLTAAVAIGRFALDERAGVLIWADPDNYLIHVLGGAVVPRRWSRQDMR